MEVKRPLNKQSIKASSGAGQTPNKQSIYIVRLTPSRGLRFLHKHLEILLITDATMFQKPKGVYKGG